MQRHPAALAQALAPRALTIARLERIGWALALALVALSSLMPAGGLLAHTLADDAFYYLEIARRAFDPLGPSFDGIHVTTGFHPLWLMVLALVERVLPDDPWLVARVTVALSSLCVLGWALVLPRLLAPSLGSNAARIAGITVLVSSGLLRIGMLGMESPLAVLLFLLFLDALFVRASSPRTTALIGGLALLARLDMLPSVAIALAVYAWGRDRAAWMRALRIGVGAGLTFAPFVLWLYARTGHLSTTSAATKSTVVALEAQARFGGRLTAGFARWALSALVENGTAAARLALGGIVRGPAALIAGDVPTDERLTASRALLALALLALFALAFVLAAGGAQRTDAEADAAPHRARSTRGPLQVLWIASAAHLLLVSTLLPGQSDRWYWALEAVTFAATVGWLAAHEPSARAARTVLLAQALGSLLLALGLSLGWARGTLGSHRSFLSAVTTVASAIPAHARGDERVGARNAGALGWFSRRGVLNLDGLVSDFSLLEARRANAVGAWVERAGVRWFADCVPRGETQAYARSIGRDPSAIREVFRVDGGRCDGVLWELVRTPAVRTAALDHANAQRR